MSNSHCDLLFINGRLVDGTGGPSQLANLAVKDGRIAWIGQGEPPTATEVIDLRGLALCPGFIDTHTHDDRALLVTPDMAHKTSQGVTTVVAGNCGVSLAPLTLRPGPVPSPLTELGAAEDFVFPSFKAYVDALESAPPAVNTVCLVGHTTLRAGAMDRLDRPATPAEIVVMLEGVNEAMAAGAAGVSSGLFYPPAQAAPAEEVKALLGPVARLNGVYTAHIRDEGDRVTEALDETFDIAETAGVRLVVSHHKLAGSDNWGRAPETLRQISLAATRQPVAFDVYPYDASATMLNADSWAAASRTLVSWSEPHPDAAGKTLEQAARDLGVDERTALDLLSPGGGVYFMMDEADVRRILSHPGAMIGSDGVPLKARPHPRLWGSFTRVLGHYSRDLALFPLEEAVRRMTGLPASVFRLADRGVLSPGAIADLVVIDPETVGDEATFDDPTLPSRGVEAVYVAGIAVWKNGAVTGARPGQVLKPV